MVACEPNGGVGTESKFMDDSVPLAINVPEMYRMVSSRSVPMRILHLRASEIEVKGRQGVH